MSDEDVAAVVRDYFEGWFDGDVGRMDLVKRRAGEQLGITTRQRMLELTAAGEGKDDRGDGTLEVEVDEVRGEIASARVRSAVYDEFVHLVRTSYGWKIANTVWRLRQDDMSTG